MTAQTDSEFNERQLFIIHLAVAKVKETVSRLASEHRDLHSSVSKVGKTIDRVCISIRIFPTQKNSNAFFM